MALSKRLRYEVLRRDNHTCRYCGAKAADAEITIDHVTPVALGGTDLPANLVAACRDCNSGKSATPPGAVLIADVAGEDLRWARAIKAAAAMRDADREERDRERREILAWFPDMWQAHFGDRRDLSPEFVTSVQQFFGAGLSWDDLDEALDASSRIHRRDPWRYFCGVAWTMVADLQRSARALLAQEDGR